MTTAFVDHRGELEDELEEEEEAEEEEEEVNVELDGLEEEASNGLDE